MALLTYALTSYMCPSMLVPTLSIFSIAPQILVVFRPTFFYSFRTNLSTSSNVSNFLTTCSSESSDSPFILVLDVDYVVFFENYMTLRKLECISYLIFS